MPTDSDDVHSNISDVFNAPEQQWNLLLHHAPEPCISELEAAFNLASEVHAGQCRRTAESEPSVPYIVHPIRVARILLEEWGQTECRVLVTALLHDILEDCPPEVREQHEEAMRMTVGDLIVNAVADLTKARLPEPAPPEVKATRDARYFAVLRSAPEWIRLVKCADRVDNLRDAINYGNLAFWTRYSSETVGWHLYLAHETAPIAEVALFRELVRGSRLLQGRVPVWADGFLIDPVAAALLPEHIARSHSMIGLALRGDILVTGMLDPEDAIARHAAHLASRKTIEAIAISRGAFEDALRSGLYGVVGN